MNAILFATAKPLAVILLAGVIKFLYDYQTNPKLIPAILDGATSAALMAASYLGVNGAVSGVQSARGPKE